MSKVRKPKPPSFRVGDRVTFLWGARPGHGVVVEDRGAIGYQRRRLYRIRLDADIDDDPDEPRYTEVPEEEMQPEEPSPPPVLEKARVIQYFKNGGLIAILMQNFLDIHPQPKVWLGFDSLNNVRHTFRGEMGIVGGVIVPLAAVEGMKVLADKRDEVLAFLQSFGLTPAEARDVLQTVGTTPG